MPINFKENGHTISLQEMPEGVKLPGLSEKRILNGPDGNLYMLKSVKGRTIATVMNAQTPYIPTFIEECKQQLLSGDKKADEEIIEQALKTYADYVLNTPLTELNKNIMFKMKQDFRKQLTVHGIEHNKIQAVLSRFDALERHVSSTLSDFMHTEKLGPVVAKALWGNNVVVPDTFYPTEINPNEPQILSRMLKANEGEAPFNEFMRPHLNALAAKRVLTLNPTAQQEFFKLANKHFSLSSKNGSPGKNAEESYQDFLKNPDQYKFEVEAPSFWLNLQKVDPSMSLPKMADLNLSTDQKKILGKLYAMALITGHYDILNNINGTNSGSMAGKPMCVDWGNSFMIGFGGLTKDENIFSAKMGADKTQNPFSLIMGSEDYQQLQQQWASMEYGINSNEFTFPFLNQVFPYLPRLLVQDLFNLDDPDVFAGFSEFIQMADQNKDNLLGAMMEAWPGDNKELAGTLNKTWYSPDNFESSDSVGHIVLERIKQLSKILPQLKQGERQAGFQNALIGDIKNTYQAAYQPKNRIL